MIYKHTINLPYCFAKNPLKFDVYIFCFNYVFILFIYSFIHLSDALTPNQRLECNLWKLVLSHQVDPLDQAQFGKLANKGLHLPSHPTASMFSFSS